jgi:hypothetical protein
MVGVGVAQFPDGLLRGPARMCLEPRSQLLAAASHRAVALKALDLLGPAPAYLPGSSRRGADRAADEGPEGAVEACVRLTATAAEGSLDSAAGPWQARSIMPHVALPTKDAEALADFLRFLSELTAAERSRPADFPARSMGDHPYGIDVLCHDLA